MTHKAHVWLRTNPFHYIAFSHMAQKYSWQYALVYARAVITYSG